MSKNKFNKPVLSVLGSDIVKRATQIKFNFKPGQFRRLMDETDAEQLATLANLAKAESYKPFEKNLIKMLKALDEQEQKGNRGNDDHREYIQGSFFDRSR